MSREEKLSVQVYGSYAGGSDLRLRSSCGGKGEGGYVRLFWSIEMNVFVLDGCCFGNQVAV